MKRFNQSIRCDANVSRARIEDDLDIEIGNTIDMLEDIASNPQDFTDFALKDILESVSTFNKSLRRDLRTYK